MTGFDIGIVVAAWLTGLAGGSGHCLGMCGGIVGALGVGQGQSWRGLARTLAAHVGRVTSYSVAGTVAGYAGATVFAGIFGGTGMVVLRGVAAALIFAIGLKLLIGRPLLASLERVGARFWKYLSPQVAKLVPPRDPVRAFAVGALWGWLPCGLVYAELAVAAAAGSAVGGALVMAAFGVGTIVALSAVGVLLHSLGLSRLPRQASGALLILFALWTLLPVLRGGGPMH